MIVFPAEIEVSCFHNSLLAGIRGGIEVSKVQVFDVFFNNSMFRMKEIE